MASSLVSPPSPPETVAIEGRTLPADRPDRVGAGTWWALAGAMLAGAAAAAAATAAIVASVTLPIPI